MLKICSQASDDDKVGHGLKTLGLNFIVSLAYCDVIIFDTDSYFLYTQPW